MNTAAAHAQTVLAHEFDSVKADLDWRDAELLRLGKFLGEEGYQPRHTESATESAVDIAIRVIRTQASAMPPPKEKP